MPEINATISSRMERFVISFDFALYADKSVNNAKAESKASLETSAGLSAFTTRRSAGIAIPGVDNNIVLLCRLLDAAANRLIFSS